MKIKRTRPQKSWKAEAKVFVGSWSLSRAQLTSRGQITNRRSWLPRTIVTGELISRKYNAPGVGETRNKECVCVCVARPPEDSLLNNEEQAASCKTLCLAREFLLFDHPVDTRPLSYRFLRRTGTSSTEILAESKTFLSHFSVCSKLHSSLMQASTSITLIQVKIDCRCLDRSYLPSHSHGHSYLRHRPFISSRYTFNIVIF